MIIQVTENVCNATYHSSTLATEFEVGQVATPLTYRILGIVRERKLSQHVDCCSIREKMFMNLVFLFKIFHDNIK